MPSFHPCTRHSLLIGAIAERTTSSFLPLPLPLPLPLAHCGAHTEGKHRGFGFVVFSEVDEAEDAIDNMHLNELNGVSRLLFCRRGLPCARLHRCGWESETGER